jgi:hypothetical protein
MLTEDEVKEVRNSPNNVIRSLPSSCLRINLFFLRQVIILSASANKLAKLKGHAATYASLIMEELDPDDRGYIEVQIQLLFPVDFFYTERDAYDVLRNFRNADLAAGDAAPGHGERTGADGEDEADDVEPGTDNDPVTVPEPAEAAHVQVHGLHPRELEEDMARHVVACRQHRPVRVQVRAV